MTLERWLKIRKLAEQDNNYGLFYLMKIDYVIDKKIMGITNDVPKFKLTQIFKIERINIIK